jgi:glutamine synthetase
LRKRAVDLVFHDGKYVIHTVFAGRGKTIERGPAEQHCARSRGEGFDHVRAAPYAAVNEDRAVCPILRTAQQFEWRDSAVELTATVVRENDSVGARSDAHRPSVKAP